MPTLLLTQRFPPHRGAAARRLAYLTRFFERTGGPVFVIRRGKAAEPEISEVTQTISLGGRDLRRLTGQEGKTLGAQTKKNPLIRWLLRLRQAYPFVYLTDDGGPAYRRAAFTAACEIIEREGIDTLFSSFRPWSDHLVARRLKKRYPHLRWVADFRDLPVDPVRNDLWFPALQRWWGRRVIAAADEVWAVSEGQKAQLAGWHGRLVVRYNPLLALPPELPAPATGKFTITYTGSLYPGLQTVAPLVGALQELLAGKTIVADKLCLQYRGKDAALFRQWTAGLPAHCLDVEPFIAPAAAQKMQHSATVLLLLNWSAPGYYGVLTAKLWDYLATGRPVLALVNGPGDRELQDIIQGADAGAVFTTEEQAELKTWLTARYLAWAPTGVLTWRPDVDRLREYLG